MIEVVTSAGDRAEAETPEAAVVAARTLIDDARAANPVYGNNPTATFLVAGIAVRCDVRRGSL